MYSQAGRCAARTRWFTFDLPGGPVAGCRKPRRQLQVSRLQSSQLAEREGTETKTGNDSRR